MTSTEPNFTHDLLRGADEIAVFLYGSPNFRRKVYHLVATSTLPTFKLGSMICARKTGLLRWVEAQEGKHANDNAKPSSSAPPVISRSPPTLKLTLRSGKNMLATFRRLFRQEH